MVLPIGTIVSLKHSHLIGVTIPNISTTDYNLIRFREYELGYTIELFYKDEHLEVIL